MPGFEGDNRKMLPTAASGGCWEHFVEWALGRDLGDYAFDVLGREAAEGRRNFQPARPTCN